MPNWTGFTLAIAVLTLVLLVLTRRSQAVLEDVREALAGGQGLVERDRVLEVHGVAGRPVPADRFVSASQLLGRDAFVA